jgi:hypothetical protein
MVQFGTVFEYETAEQGSRVKYLKCRLLQQVGEYTVGSAIDHIWFDTMTGDLWLVPDAKCNWDISDNFPVHI